MFNRIITLRHQAPEARHRRSGRSSRVALGSLSGMLGYKVITDDTAGFLPKSAESARPPSTARSTSASRRARAR